VAQVVWLDIAVSDLESIHEYTAKENPAAARRLVEAIVQASDRLAAFPYSGRQVPGGNDESVRQLVVQNYLVVYRISGDVVEVAMVHHGARLFPGYR